MRLIPDWHKAWRWFSVQFITAAAATQVALISFPDSLKAYIPESWMHALAIVLLIAAVLGRLIDQPKA